MTDAFSDHGIVVFDVDETITLRHRSHIPPAIADLQVALARRGTLVASCTARSIDELATFRGQLARAAARAELAHPVAVHLFSACAAVGHRLWIGAGRHELEPLYAIECEGVRRLARDHRALAARLSGGGAAWSCAPGYPAPRQFWQHEPHGYVIADRGQQITMTFRQPEDAGAMADALPGYVGEPVRVIRHGPHTLHVLPGGAGKHLSLRWLREVEPAAPALLIGDGFVGSAAGEGGDMDLYHHRDARCTCVQIGDEPPLHPDIAAIPLPGSPASIVLRLFAPGMTLAALRQLSEALVGQREPVIELARTLFPDSPADHARLRELAASLLDELPAEQVLARLSACHRPGRSPWQRMVPLVSPRLLDHADRLGFAGNAALFVCWLWRELGLSPHLSVAERLAACRGDDGDPRWQRAPILAEETPVYLLALAPAIASGHRVFLVGKDAEPFEPGLVALDRSLRDHQLFAPSSPPLSIESFRVDANRPIAEHIAAMLPAASAAELLAVERRRAIGQTIGDSDTMRARLEAVTGHGDLDAYFARTTRGQIVADLADRDLDPRFDAAFELIRFKVDAQRRFLEPMFALDRPVELAPVVRHYEASGSGPLHAILGRYVAIEGDATLTPARWLTLARLLIDVTWPLCAEVYGKAEPFSARFAPVLVEVLADTELSRFRGSTISFFDVGFGLGATMMLCRGIAAVLGAASATFAVARLPWLPARPGCPDPTAALARGLAGWCTDSVAPEEERPSMLPFHYPGRTLQRVHWVDVLRGLDHAPGQPIEIAPDELVASRDRSERLRRRIEQQLDGLDAELEANGIPFHDVVRLWLRRDSSTGEIWRLQVKHDRIVFRDYSVVRRLEAIVDQVLVLLDARVGDEEAAQLRRADEPLHRRETLQLIERWLAEYERERRREQAGLASVVDAHGRERVAAYLRQPTQAGFADLRDLLVAQLSPSAE